MENKRKTILTLSSVLLLLSSLSLGFANLSEGLVVYYPLDYNVSDMSNNNYSGVEYSKIFYPEGKVTSSALANSSEIRVPRVSKTSNASEVWLPSYDFTVSAWVYITQGEAMSIWSTAGMSSVASNRFGFYLAYNGARLVSEISINSGRQGVTSGSILNTGWHHLILRRNNTNYDIYLDNELYGSTTVNSGPITWDGAYNDGESKFYLFNTNHKGKLDEVVVWNRSITISEIEELYNNGTGRSLFNLSVPIVEEPPSYNLTYGLITYYPFDYNGSDMSFNNHSGLEYSKIFYCEGKVGYAALANNSEFRIPKVPKTSNVSEVWLPSYDFTIAGWVYINEGKPMVIWNTAESSSLASNRFGYNLYYTGSSISALTVVNSIEKHFTGGLVSSGWHYVVFRRYNTEYSLSNFDIYVDNEYYGSFIFDGSSITWTGNYNDDLHSYFFNTNQYGKLDEIAIWNRSITHSEMSELYNNGTGKALFNLSAPIIEELPTYDLDDGLITYYPLDDNVIDFSENGYNGTEYTNITYLKGSIDKSALANNSEIRIPRVSKTSNVSEVWLPSYNFTIASWVYVTQGEPMSILSAIGTSSVASYRFGYNFFYTGSSISSNIIINRSMHTISGNSLNTGWYHVVLRRSYSNYFLSNYDLFVDGELYANAIINGGAVTWDGTYNDEDSRFYLFNINHKGKLDDVAIWNRSLNLTEIQNLYSSGLVINNCPIEDGQIVNESIFLPDNTVCNLPNGFSVIAEGINFTCGNNVLLNGEEYIYFNSSEGTSVVGCPFVSSNITIENGNISFYNVSFNGLNITNNCEDLCSFNNVSIDFSYSYDGKYYSGISFNLNIPPSNVTLWEITLPNIILNMDYGIKFYNVTGIKEIILNCNKGVVNGSRFNGSTGIYVNTTDVNVTIQNCIFQNYDTNVLLENFIGDFFINNTLRYAISRNLYVNDASDATFRNIEVLVN